MNYFDELLEKFNFMSTRVMQTNMAFRSHDKLKEICPEYIYASYCVAHSTVPLMQETLRCAALIKDDPVCKPLSDYLIQHIEEETDHDKWVLDDLEALGLPKAEVKKRIQPPNMAAMIGSQFYWVRQLHPISFMGYIASMEVYPPSEEYVGNLIIDSGLPAAGFNTLMMHAKIDIAHRKDIINLMNTLPLTPGHKRIIEMSAFQTYRYLALIMEDICRSADM